MVVELIELIVELIGLFIVFIISIGYQPFFPENKAKVVFMLDDLMFSKKSWKGFNG
jgi:hypothetical protein